VKKELSGWGYKKFNEKRIKWVKKELSGWGYFPKKNFFNFFFFFKKKLILPIDNLKKDCIITVYDKENKIVFLIR
jgi:hypothetical protein